MKIRVWPQADGTSKIYLQKTRPKEGKNRLFEGVKPEDFEGFVEKAIK